MIHCAAYMRMNCRGRYMLSLDSIEQLQQAVHLVNEVRGWSLEKLRSEAKDKAVFQEDLFWKERYNHYFPDSIMSNLRDTLNLQSRPEAEKDYFQAFTTLYDALIKHTTHHDHGLNHGFSPGLYDDKGFYMALADGPSNDYWIMERASDKIKSDKTIVHKFIAKSAQCTMRAVKDFFGDDVSTVTLAIKALPNTICYASERVQSMHSIMEMVVSQEGQLLKHAKGGLNDNFILVKIAVKNSDCSDDSGFKESHALKYASARLRDNFELVKTAVICSVGDEAFRHASLNLQNNPILQALANSDELKQRARDKQRTGLYFCYKELREIEEPTDLEQAPNMRGGIS